VSFELIRPPDRRYTFHYPLVEADDRHIILAHEAYPSKPLHVQGEEVMGSGYPVVWFLFKDEPFDVGRFYRPDGAWTGYYVDILEPVRWQNANPHSLEPLVDLFLDLWITPDGEHLVLDEDEFAVAAANGYLTDEQVRHAQETLQRLISAISRNEFPPPLVRAFHR
jgi:predicted RNA-binding protein associated with RNAse of E/G family